MKRKHLLALALTFSCWTPCVGSAADAPPPAPEEEAADEVSANDASDEDVPWCEDETIVKGAESLIRVSGGTPLHFAALNNDMWPGAALDWLVGLCGAAAVRLAVYLKGKDAKKYRKNVEYGSARWGNKTDIAPFMDPKPET